MRLGVGRYTVDSPLGYTNAHASTRFECCNQCGLHTGCQDFVYQHSSGLCVLLPHASTSREIMGRAVSPTAHKLFPTEFAAADSCSSCRCSPVSVAVASSKMTFADVTPSTLSSASSSVLQHPSHRMPEKDGTYVLVCPTAAHP